MVQTFNVFIRGIFSTALTKLFKDSGFRIIFPSTPISQRFDINNKMNENYSKDIIISDRFGEDLSVSVKKDVWEKIEDDFPLNQINFPNILKLNSKFALNSIFKGIIIQSNKLKGYSLVRLLSDVDDDIEKMKDNFGTKLGRVNRYLKVGSENIFQIRTPDCGKKFAFLTEGYTVSGDLAVIMPGNKRAFISKKIRDREMRDKLLRIIEKVSTNDFGLLLRTASQFASELEILKEIQKLRDKYLEIESLINQSDSLIGSIWSEYKSFNYLLPSTTKIKLDEIRSSVVPTLALHHEIKASLDYGGKMQIKVLNLLEKVLNVLQSKGFSDPINTEFISFYYGNLYRPKQLLSINHRKINARKINLRPGIIKKIERNRSRPDSLKIILRRNLGGRGGNDENYDGLDVPIEEGDYAIGVYEAGNMYYETIYYSNQNELKGKYFNINTPIMFKPEGIDYYDLEIDVVEPLNSKRKIIDQDLLDSSRNFGIISESLYNKANKIAERIQSGEIQSEIDEKNGYFMI